MANGILIKTPDALEKLSEIDQIVFDKTGTLTYGRPYWVNKNKFSKVDIKLISSIASASKHPLSRAVYDSSLPTMKVQVEEVKGMGLIAKHGNKTYKLGNYTFCEGNNKSLDDKIELWFRKSPKQVQRLVFEDNPKADAKSLIEWFKKVGIKSSILSGDRSPVVARLAAKLGIITFKSEVRPIEKFKYLEQLNNDGMRTLMVGDGLNDSAALKAAHVSISPSSAVDLAQTHADIVIQGDKVWPIKESYLVAKQSNKLVIQNFVLSFLYNAVTIPFAMSGLATPVLAAIAMSLSSLMVVGNSLRLNINN
jgi:Cu2+-exporting ATPase